MPGTMKRVMMNRGGDKGKKKKPVKMNRGGEPMNLKKGGASSKKKRGMARGCGAATKGKGYNK